MESNYFDILITAKQVDDYSRRQGLKRVLTGMYLWGIGVGAVIPSIFFGWNQGLSIVEPTSFLIASLLVTAFYLLLSLILAELATCFPYAGGPYAYARKGLGSFWGFLAGIATIIQFLCASAAITIAIGSYISYLNPNIPPEIIGLVIYALFLFIDMLGIRISAVAQLVLTTAAITALILFLMGTANAFQVTALPLNQPLAGGWNGILMAIPFALWFYLCIGGISMTAEETRNSGPAISFGYISSVVTVAVLSTAIILFSLAAVDWKLLIGNEHPLAYVLSYVQPGDRVLTLVFSYLCLFGLLAGLHSMINSFSRQTFALSRAGYLPKGLHRIHNITRTPYLAILLPGLVGMLLSSRLSATVLFSLTGYAALLTYLIVLFSYLAISKRDVLEPVGRRLKKKGLVWIAVLCSVGILILYTIKEFSHIKDAVIVLILASVYYFLIGKNFVSLDAPEEVEARFTKIYTREKLG